MDCAGPGACCLRFNDAESCNAFEGCAWQVPPGCGDGEIMSLEQAGCFPEVRCSTDADCENPLFRCQETTVMPECAITTDPEEPVCDACAEVRGLCVP